MRLRVCVAGVGAILLGGLLLLPVTAGAAGTVPGSVTNLVVTSGNGFVSASWAAPATDGGSPIVAYSVSATTPDGAPAGWTNILPDATEASVDGLADGVTYNVYVLAWNANGASEAESLGSPSSTGPAPTVPGEPQSISMVPLNDCVSQCDVSWTAPATDGGAPIVAYSVVEGYGTGPFITYTWAATNSMTRHVHFDTPADVVYVWAYNSAGPGPAIQEGSYPF